MLEQIKVEYEKIRKGYEEEWKSAEPIYARWEEAKNKSDKLEQALKFSSRMAGEEDAIPQNTLRETEQELRRTLKQNYPIVSQKAMSKALREGKDVKASQEEIKAMLVMGKAETQTRNRWEILMITFGMLGIQWERELEQDNCKDVKQVLPVMEETAECLSQMEGKIFADDFYGQIGIWLFKAWEKEEKNEKAEDARYLYDQMRTVLEKCKKRVKKYEYLYDCGDGTRYQEECWMRKDADISFSSQQDIENMLQQLFAEKTGRYGEGKLSGVSGIEQYYMQQLLRNLLAAAGEKRVDIRTYKKNCTTWLWDSGTWNKYEKEMKRWQVEEKERKQAAERARKQAAERARKQNENKQNISTKKTQRQSTVKNVDESWQGYSIPFLPMLCASVMLMVTISITQAVEINLLQCVLFSAGDSLISAIILCCIEVQRKKKRSYVTLSKQQRFADLTVHFGICLFWGLAASMIFNNLNGIVSALMAGIVMYVGRIAGEHL